MHVVVFENRSSLASLRYLAAELDAARTCLMLREPHRPLFHNFVKMLARPLAPREKQRHYRAANSQVSSR